MAALKLHTSNTLDIYSALSDTTLELPVESGGISAGFPSPAMDLSPQDKTQLRLFDNIIQTHVPLMMAMDKIYAMCGQQKIRLPAKDIKRVWKMKQEKLSPRYTTNLSEIITSKV